MHNPYLDHSSILLEYRRLKRLAFPGCEKQNKEYKHKWYIKNKTITICRTKTWQKQNPEKFKEYLKKSEQKRKENGKRLEFGRRYNQSNKERLNALARSRYNSNLPKYRNINHVKRSRRRNVPHSDCSDKIESLNRECFCRWCCVRLTDENRTIDHIIPLNRGGHHKPDNLAAACHKCNSGRCDKLIEEWTWILAA